MSVFETCRRNVVFSYSVFFLFPFFFFPLGCSTTPEPRVIAERVFAGDRLEAIVTTYPGDPGELNVVSCETSEDSTTTITIKVEKIEIEGRPGWRFRCGAPVDADEFTLHAVVRHAGRRFEVAIPFRRRNTYIARQGKDVKRWTTRRERITLIGDAPLF